MILQDLLHHTAAYPQPETGHDSSQDSGKANVPDHPAGELVHMEVLGPEAAQEGGIGIEDRYIQGTESDYDPGEEDQEAGDAQHKEDSDELESLMGQLLIALLA